MDIRRLLKELMDEGLTQKDISNHVGCSQSAISQMVNRKIKNPSFNTGTAIINVHEKYCSRK